MSPSKPRRSRRTRLLQTGPNILKDLLAPAIGAPPDDPGVLAEEDGEVAMIPVETLEETGTESDSSEMRDMVNRLVEEALETRAMKVKTNNVDTQTDSRTNNEENGIQTEDKTTQAEIDIRPNTPLESLIELHTLVAKHVTDSEIQDKFNIHLGYLRGYYKQAEVIYHRSKASSPTKSRASTLESKKEEIRVSYAEATQDKQRTIIIKPTKETSATALKDKITSIAGPSSVEITQVRETRSGELLVKCSEATGAEALQQAISRTEDMQEKIQGVRGGTVRLASIVIQNVPDHVGSDAVEKALSDQLGLDKGIGIVRPYQGRPGSKHWRVLVPARTLGSILSQGTITIGSRSCQIRKFVEVIRCFRCQEFGHRSTTCTNPVRCARCAKGGHGREECQSNRSRCFNCASVNQMYRGTNLDANHDACSNSCPTYQRKLNLARGIDNRRQDHYSGRQTSPEPRTYSRDREIGNGRNTNVQTRQTQRQNPTRSGIDNGRSRTTKDGPWILVGGRGKRWQKRPSNRVA